MRIRVRLFAVARQLAGQEWVDLDLPDDATTAHLRAGLADRVPQMSGLLEQMMFAIGSEYAKEGCRIPSGADVACIPPVSGG